MVGCSQESVTEIIKKHRLTGSIKAEVLSEYSIKLSTSTVQRRLRGAGLFGRKPRRKPHLTTKHKRDRLSFARSHKNWNPEEWARVVFSDESRFLLYTNDGRAYIRRMKGEEFSERCLQKTCKFGGGGIMVWGCFLLEWRRTLVNAVPVIFQAGPSYLNTTGQIAKRLNLESKEEENFAKALHDSIIQDQQDSLQFGLRNFEDLKIKLPELHLNQDWTTWYFSSNTLEIIHLEFANQSPHILSTLSIHSDLTVSVVANTKFL
ncbi:Transposable element Tcb2 transposase [Oopsacas minuta]|uniref:Transposable element Tcb2 transposase n=1 Tax=Oopsacas minuta TaxID=111878 RepID=A0AAV7KE11_9METZ|nr:Transposable element Tcb2 transposase [Oopsacas minuta]